jgi:hypothetical protein
MPHLSLRVLSDLEKYPAVKLAAGGHVVRDPLELRLELAVIVSNPGNEIPVSVPYTLVMLTNLPRNLDELEQGDERQRERDDLNGAHGDPL